MKKIKIVSGNLNNQFSTITPTSVSKDGRIRSLKKDGTFIEGRYPTDEERPLLWEFSLTSKERIDKHNTQLHAYLHIPEPGIDHIEDGEKRMLALYDFLSNHQNGAYYKVIDGQKKQVNPNFKRHHLLYFEIIDESAIEADRFNNARLETKYRAKIDELFDLYPKNDGEWLELCYGMGIGRPEQNNRIQNYNLLMNKLSLNPGAFEVYWEDPDRNMVNVIQKGLKKINPESDKPYITQNETGLYFFNAKPIAKNMGELKVHFKQNDKEFEWLSRCVSVKPKKEELPSLNQIEPENKIVVKITDMPKQQMDFPSKEGMEDKDRHKFGDINREIALIISMLDKCNREQKPKDSAIKRTENLRIKHAKHIDYINLNLDKKLLERGLTL